MHTSFFSPSFLLAFCGNWQGTQVRSTFHVPRFLRLPARLLGCYILHRMPLLYPSVRAPSCPAGTAESWGHVQVEQIRAAPCALRLPVSGEYVYVYIDGCRRRRHPRAPRWMSALGRGTRSGVQGSAPSAQRSGLQGYRLLVLVTTSWMGCFAATHPWRTRRPKLSTKVTQDGRKLETPPLPHPTPTPDMKHSPSTLDARPAGFCPRQLSSTVTTAASRWLVVTCHSSPRPRPLQDPIEHRVVVPRQVRCLRLGRPPSSSRL
ncbi:hypothetical protein L226DRAFT_215015 [Lentinus tigrinus ALCF2SS1-7]|uniref:Uncharacterized protein n=1 Tax=Lentinus tigrinus ALCF2SS1-6 TaxID=1328759 RepID=A0A5C2RZB6_9APHY|nr:hypothetical protein L227DRAFT_284905 [Lentinus tigrinus ALCF2SS1-6]RPD71091.1 hypothetical protein L226DRAFT_215015 [Lentinus tigrinus ALCF2SS1-7]